MTRRAATLILALAFPVSMIAAPVPPGEPVRCYRAVTFGDVRPGERFWHNGVNYTKTKTGYQSRQMFIDVDGDYRVLWYTAYQTCDPNADNMIFYDDEPVNCSER